MKEPLKPKVSVCMPNYNCSRYLAEAIESVLKQSYEDFEFIIIDDCSTDNSLDIIRQYAEKDKRIIDRVNNVNIGQAKNLNLCLKYAQGDYIKFVFSDDLLSSSDALKKMVTVLDTDDDVALVASARYSINESSEILGVLSEYKGGIACQGTEIIKDSLFTQSNKVGEPTVVLFRKKHSTRGFDEQYSQNVDWEMWFHILEQGNFVYIDEPLYSFRTHPLQQTKLNLEKKVHLVEPFLLLKDYGKKPYMSCSAWKKMYLYYNPAFEIWNLYRKGRKIGMRTALKAIDAQYGGVKFVLLYPSYKMYKSFLSIQKRVRRILSRSEQR